MKEASDLGGGIEAERDEGEGASGGGPGAFGEEIEGGDEEGAGGDVGMGGVGLEEDSGEGDPHGAEGGGEDAARAAAAAEGGDGEAPEEDEGELRGIIEAGVPREEDIPRGKQLGEFRVAVDVPDMGGDPARRVLLEGVVGLGRVVPDDIPGPARQMPDDGGGDDEGGAGGDERPGGELALTEAVEQEGVRPAEILQELRAEPGEGSASQDPGEEGEMEGGSKEGEREAGQELGEAEGLEAGEDGGGGEEEGGHPPLEGVPPGEERDGEGVAGGQRQERLEDPQGETHGGVLNTTPASPFVVQDLTQADVELAVDDVQEAMELLGRQAEALLEETLGLIKDSLAGALEAA